MDHHKIMEGLIAARDGLKDAYQRLGFAPHEVSNDDLVLPKVETALIELRESVELFDAFYEVTERDIDYDRAQKLGAAVDRHLWTVVEGDGGNLYVTAGWAYVNRLEYLITKEAWTDQNETWLWADFSDSEDSDEDDSEDAEATGDDAIVERTDHEALWRRIGLDRRIDADALTVSFMDLLCEEIDGGADATSIRPRVEARIDSLLKLVPEDFRPEVFKVLAEAGYRPPEHRD